MNLTARDLAEIRAIVERHCIVLAIELTGAQSVGVDSAEVAALVESGILSPEAIGALDPVRDAYTLGLLRRRLEQAGIDPKTLSMDGLRKMLATDPLPLTASETAAVTQARLWAGQHVVGISGTVAGDIVRELSDMAHGDGLRGAIGEETAASLSGHEMARQLSTRLSDTAQGWTKDWLRVASTELHGAQEQGFATDIAKTFGPNARVALIPNPDACKHCRRLTLENGRPKIWRLAELVANGSNVGRKAIDWKAVIGPIHPWCACTLVFVPEGMEFSADWILVPIAEK